MNAWKFPKSIKCIFLLLWIDMQRHNIQFSFHWNLKFACLLKLLELRINIIYSILLGFWFTGLSWLGAVRSIFFSTQTTYQDLLIKGDFGRLWTSMPTVEFKSSFNRQGHIDSTIAWLSCYAKLNHNNIRFQTVFYSPFVCRAALSITLSSGLWNWDDDLCLIQMYLTQV